MTPDSPGIHAGGRPARPVRTAVGWSLLLALFVYLWCLYQGLGVPRGGFATEWWHPDRSWLDIEWIANLDETPLRGSAILTAPAALLAAAVFWGTSSGIARWLALSGVTSCLLMGFYGLGPSRVWEFFHFRGTLVMLTIGFCLGAAAASPWLTRSWLRLRPLWQAVVYVPIVLAIVILLRHTTGTDESLSFNFSPWPAVTIFGLEIGAYAVVGMLLGSAIALAGLAQWPAAGRAVPLIAIGLVTPALWLIARFGSIPGLAVGALVAMTLAGCTVATLSPGRTPAARAVLVRKRARIAAMGALLTFVPLFVGRAMSTADYTVTRYVRARAISDALAVFYDRRDGYPDQLLELVELGYIDEIPRPRVGFDLLYALSGAEPLEFQYQSLGSSYVLEFEFTEWVQCAYNPPWEDDFEDEDLYDGEGEGDGRFDGDDWDDDEGGEAWSCPESRPELW